MLQTQKNSTRLKSLKSTDFIGLNVQNVLTIIGEELKQQILVVTLVVSEHIHLLENQEVLVLNMLNKERNLLMLMLGKVLKKLLLMLKYLVHLSKDIQLLPDGEKM